MFKRIFPLIALMVIGVFSLTHAQEIDSLFSQLESGALSLKNPFSSQLPRKEAPASIEPFVEQKNIEPPVPEPTCADGIKHCLTRSDCLGRGYYWYGNECNSRPEFSELITPPSALVMERSLPNLTINGVIWNSDRPQAIINGQIVGIGDIISEIEITGIQKEGIEGLFDGRAVTLKP